MRKLKTTILLLAIVIISSCGNNNNVIVKDVEVTEFAKLATINFIIKGMNCDDEIAEKTASKVVELEGVSKVKLNCLDGATFVTYDIDLITPDGISKGITTANPKLSIKHLNTETGN
jgi:hypothetical protein